MTLQVDASMLVGFAYALVRATAFLVIAPPFSTVGVPVRARAGFAAGLALVLTPSFQGSANDLQTAAFLGGLLYQALVGLALGFLVYLLFAAFQTAGALIDLSAAFSGATLYDPFSNAATSPLARLYQQLAIGILFAINGHLMLVQGLVTSVKAAPLDGLRLDSFAELLLTNISVFMVAAVQIAFPMLAALFLSEVVLGLLSRAAPQMNIFIVGFNLKMLIVIMLGGLALSSLPDAVVRILERIGTDALVVFGGR